MARMWNNGDFRIMLRNTALLLASFLVLLGVLLFLGMGAIRGTIAGQSAAIVGRVLAVHPELEADIIGAVTDRPSAAEVQIGQAALARYGYTADTPLSVHPVLSRMIPGVSMATVVFLLLLGACLLALLTHGYGAIYRRVKEIYTAAERVVDGDFGVHLPAGEEGDFEILGHRFNQMANRLKLSLDQLQQEKVFLKNIISDISHQLKTPLSSLVVYNDILSEDLGMDEAQRQSFLGMERQQLQRLEWLIQSLLEMARLEAGSIAFRREEVPLLETVRAAAVAVETMAAEAGVCVVLPQDGDAVFWGDGEWLCEALINILKNGIEHSKPGGAVRIELERSPLFASIRISDRGEGIAPGDLPHIFERFYRGSRAVKPDSVGIGLALTKAIVEGQGGSISVSSQPGRGSEFTITFLSETLDG